MGDDDESIRVLEIRSQEIKGTLPGEEEEEREKGEKHEMGNKGEKKEKKAGKGETAWEKNTSERENIVDPRDADRKETLVPTIRDETNTMRRKKGEKVELSRQRRGV